MRLIDADAFERAVMFSDDVDIQDVIYRLRDFPLAQPERGNAVWLDAEDDYRKQIKWFRCSECGFDSSNLYTYCPNCGSRMNYGIINHMNPPEDQNP